MTLGNVFGPPDRNADPNRQGTEECMCFIQYT